MIFATYWQALIIQYFPGVPEGNGERINDFVLCCEMSIFAIIHLYSFPWWEFRCGIPPTSELLISNVRQVLSFKDVVRDVYHNIMPVYQTYVLQSSDGGVKTYQTRTFVVGNIDNPTKSSKFLPNFRAIKEKYGPMREQSLIGNNSRNIRFTHDLDMSENESDDDNNEGQFMNQYNENNGCIVDDESFDVELELMVDDNEQDINLLSVSVVESLSSSSLQEIEFGKYENAGVLIHYENGIIDNDTESEILI